MSEATTGSAQKARPAATAEMRVSAISCSTKPSTKPKTFRNTDQGASIRSEGAATPPVSIAAITDAGSTIRCTQTILPAVLVDWQRDAAKNWIVAEMLAPAARMSPTGSRSSEDRADDEHHAGEREQRDAEQRRRDPPALDERARQHDEHRERVEDHRRHGHAG